MSMFFIVTVHFVEKILLCLFVSYIVFTVIWEIFEHYFDIWHYIDDIKEWENAIKKNKNRIWKGRRFENILKLDCD